MKKIFYIMGRSGTGKSYLYNKLIDDSIAGIHYLPLIPYTTRPIRPGEIDGHDANFVTEEFLKSLNPIETRTYNVIVNGEPTTWTYATCTNNIDLENYYYVGIGTLESYQRLREYFYNRYGEHLLIPIYITARDDELLSHYIAREAETTRNYDEMCRRFLADKDDFSYLKLEEVGITNKDTYLNNFNDNFASMVAKAILSEIIFNEAREKDQE